MRDARVPWYAKAVAGMAVAYALSPIDLIPDFIPVLGYLDDLILVPLLAWLAIALIPKAVLAELRIEAARRAAKSPIAARVGAVAIVAAWIGLSLLCAWAVFR